jgi:hypothetical protein
MQFALTHRDTAAQTFLHMSTMRITLIHTYAIVFANVYYVRGREVIVNML